MQAKYFRFSSDIDWRQVDKSVKRALAQHPNLIRYTVAFATDLSDPRGEERRTALSTWEARREKYAAIAKAAGRKVAFDFWGKSELTNRLMLLSSAGLRYYFFNHTELSAEWFRERFHITRANAGDRYTPEHNVNLELEQAITRGLGLADLRDDVLDALHKMKQAAKELAYGKPRAVFGEQESVEIVELLDATSRVTETIQTEAPTRVPWTAISEQCREVLLRIARLDRQRRTDEEQRSDGPLLRSLRHSLSHIEGLASSTEARWAEGRRMLIVGSGGIGKTHLLCRCVDQCVSRSSPAILILGELLDTSPVEAQFVRELGLNCTPAELFGGVQAAAVSNNSVALIAIDAMNEGPGAKLWKVRLSGFLTFLSKYDRLLVVLTVRDIFEREVIPAPVPAWERVEHHGFEGHELEAIDRYFGEHGVIVPSVPLLVPEFANPLFVKLLARAIALSGATTIPLGLHGLRSMFRYYLGEVEGAICDERGQDVESHPVIATVLELARAQNNVGGALPRQMAVDIAERFEGGRKLEFSKSLYKLLLASGILTEVPNIRERGTKLTRFTYQRFADMFDAEALIGRIGSVDSFDERRAQFRDVLMNSLRAFQFGAVEALSIALPEMAGTEVPDLLPDEGSLPRIFLQTLSYRDISSISDRTIELLDEYLAGSIEARLAYESLVTVSAVHDHPLNWRYLDSKLAAMSLSERDFRWTIHINETERFRAVGERLVRWCESERSRTADDATREGAATTLCWLFTASDRRLRDTASKALVNLLEHCSIELYGRLLSRFVNCSDPYVIERLLAAFFGVTTRTNRSGVRRALADCTLRDVFFAQRLPVDVLTRDFARLIVEAAADIGAIHLDEDQRAVISPPYDSLPPDLSTTPLPENDFAVIDRDAGEWGLFAIRMSLDKHGDFARYVMGSDHPRMFPFSTVPIGASRPKRRKDFWAAFESAVSPTELELFRRASQPRIPIRFFVAQPDGSEGPEVLLGVNKSNHNRREACSALRTLLKRLSGEQIALLKAYVRAPRDDGDTFESTTLSAWIYRRVLALGYEGRQFGSHDLMLRDARFTVAAGRQPTKVERIGKKYQWIALRELLARLADNYQVRETELGPQYTDSSQLRVRDIDPSCLVRFSLEERYVLEHDAWWAPIKYRPVAKDPWEHWLRRATLPSVADLLRVTDPRGTTWYALAGSYTWEETVALDLDDSVDRKRLALWFDLYLLRRDVLDRLRRMLTASSSSVPEALDLYQLFIGEYPWAPSWRSLNAVYRAENPLIQKGIQIATHVYLADGSRRDFAVEDTFSFRIPSAEIVDALNLSRAGEATWSDQTGLYKLFDPSITERGPSALLATHDTMHALRNLPDYEPIWLVGVEQMIIGSTHHRTGPGYSISKGLYRIQDSEVVLGRLTRRYEEYK